MSFVGGAEKVLQCHTLLLNTLALSEITQPRSHFCHWCLVPLPAHETVLDILYQRWSEYSPLTDVEICISIDKYSGWRIEEDGWSEEDGWRTEDDDHVCSLGSPSLLFFIVSVVIIVGLILTIFTMLGRSAHILLLEWERERQRQTDRQTDRDRASQPDRQTETESRAKGKQW